jgi:hypothetical protein
MFTRSIMLKLVQVEKIPVNIREIDLLPVLHLSFRLLLVSTVKLSYFVWLPNVGLEERKKTI